MRCVLPVVLILIHAPALVAQQLPLLDPAHIAHITQEVSGDASYEHIRHNTQFHRPGGGAPGLMDVARYYEEKAREYGLVDVRLIRQRHTTPPWSARSAELWITGSAPERPASAGDGPERLASYLQSPLHLADYSQGADVTARLVDVGAGTSAADYEGRDVRGQVVLAHGPTGTLMQEAVWLRGAAGVVWYPSPYSERNVSYPDQLNWSRVPLQSPDGRAATFAFVLSLRQGLQLRQRLAAGPVQVRARVDAGFEAGAEPWQVMVEAFIRGTEPGLGQDVVLTSHMQEEKFSANDDGSGTANVLEVARALNRLIEDGVIPRPRRNLRFWWLTEISSQRQYFADHPTAHRTMWVNINQDMVGANQAQDVMRVQNVTRLPASRFHFFNDVVESVIEYMVATNNSELAQSQAGSGVLYTRPHMARLGTRHRYNAKMIFFHNNTDHMPFNEAPIGVPGITFTNWPDHYIHTTDDDLWNVDRTQLGRNAAAVALMAYAMASADADAAPVLAAETVGRGAQRMARNLALGLSWLAAEPDKAAAYHRAVQQVRYAAAREQLAVASLASIAPAAGGMVAPLLLSVNRREAEALREVEAKYRLVTGQNRLPQARRTAQEERLAALRPAPAAGPELFLQRRGRVAGVAGLHSLMAFEVMNLVDGRRTALDIYQLVAAQAREAGEHYYGTVAAESVQRYLENLAAQELIRMQ
jgi:hypothetical protein